MIDVPEPLPTCTEIVVAMQKEFREWESIGHMRNQGVEVYTYKMPDVGNGATYVRFMLTPSVADVNWGVKTGWRYNRETLCDDHGTVTYTLILTTTAKERI